MIKEEFKTQCPAHILDEIRFGIFDNQVAKARQRHGIWGQRKGIQLTLDQQRQLFSQTSRFKKMIICYFDNTTKLI